MMFTDWPTITRAAIAGGTCVTAFILLGPASSHRPLEPKLEARAVPPSAITLSTATEGPSQAFLYGRVTTDDGVAYEGRLRFGGNEEAFWGHYFNGAKRDNPWAIHAPGAEERRPLEIFGFEISSLWEGPSGLARQMMARFGDIARIDAHGRDLRVTMKSGTVFPLDRFGADDFADGLRIWDGTRGVIDLNEWRIRSIEFLPSTPAEAAPEPLYGTVRTGHGAFTGFIQWDREQSVGADELVGHTAEGELRLRFDSIRSIARRSRDSALVTHDDGREIVVGKMRQAGNHRGIYVDDRRYGRVLVSWDVFERIDFTAGGSAPAYSDFPSGHPLKGTVTTRSGRQLTGRLVYDLDESETTETLDAPLQGVDYTIPFGMVATIAPHDADDRGASRARVRLHGGEAMALDRAGDLGDGNSGLLIFVDGRERPAYVAWIDVAQIDFERPPAMYPAHGGH